jgi:glucuronate isomerase
MADSARDTIYQAIASIRLIDPHTHINPHRPASSTLADLLGYHYYTELAHSAGMAKEAIEQPGIEPRELVGRLVHNLSPIENTAQYSWLVAICRKFFDFDGDRIDASNWEAVYEAAEARMESADWPQTVLEQSNVEAVFLTNDFDDSLAGFDTSTYIPCLRTDDLVFHLAKLPTQQRLAACSGIELDGSLSTLRQALRQRFEHFVSNGARACAISLPPSFEPKPVSDGRAETALDSVLRNGPLADATHQAALSRRVFWTLAELCDEFGIPFDLMIGVNRGVYAGGVYQGQDLYDSRVSLIQYRELFNAFPNVKFPISVLASVTNQELVSYAWIFPNVITNGHWWYSNTPSFISRDAAARLEAVPRTKQIAYYSDAYKLEFVWPKFDMYRRVLAGILADHFVGQMGWSEERAIELGQQVLRDNVDAIFPKPEMASVAASERDNAQEEPAWVEAQLEGMETTESIGGAPLEPALPTDPLPSEDEIDSVEIADVELREQGLEAIGIDRESIDREVEDEPLDVGEIFGDQDEETPSIRMLRGEQSFSTDEESLRLTPDPITGELIFNPSESEEAESDEPGDVDEPKRGANADSSESEDDRS